MQKLQDAVFVLVFTPSLSLWARQIKRRSVPAQVSLLLSCFSLPCLKYVLVCCSRDCSKAALHWWVLLPAGLMEASRYPPRALLSHEDTLCLENAEPLMSRRADAPRHGEIDPSVFNLGGNNSVFPSPSGKCSPATRTPAVELPWLKFKPDDFLILIRVLGSHVYPAYDQATSCLCSK